MKRWIQARHRLGGAGLILGLGLYVTFAHASAPAGPVSGGDPLLTQPAVSLSLLGWWTRPALLEVLALDATQRQRWIRHLTNQERSHQLAHARLREARQAQSRLLESPELDVTALRTIHQSRLQALSSELLQINFDTRLWVRQQLSAAQLQALVQRHPGFFRARWFRPARAMVIQGGVQPDPE